MPGTLYVGTSGFAYKEWKPEFYPADLKAADMLSFYSQRFSSVEINNTFYRAPSERVVKQWAERTPEDFKFTLKAPQRITHMARLRDTGENLEYFLRTAKALDRRLGCILFQCPPSLRYDGALLEAFLAALPGEPFRFAMEFRHASWNTDEVKDKMRAYGVARCVVDTDEGRAPMVQTAGAFVYMRLRGLNYTDEELQSWATNTSKLLEQSTDVYVYFKHEDDPSGVRFGLRFRGLIETDEGKTPSRAS